MSTTPCRLTFGDPPVQENARFTATPVDSPRFTFQNIVRSGSAGVSSNISRSHSTGSRRSTTDTTPRTSGWALTPPRNSAVSIFDRVPGISPKICMHGATCVKYGCTFTHPACRARDCPAGENCMRLDCPLHHPRSRPISQYKATPDCRYGARCNKVACPFKHPIQRPSPRPPPDASPALAYSGYQVGQVVEAQYSAGSKWTPATVRRIRGAKLTLQFAGIDDCVDVPRTRVRDPDDPDKEAAVVAPEPLTYDEIISSSPRPVANYMTMMSPKICMHGAACVKYGCTFAHPPSRPADCPEGERCLEVMCALHHPRTRPMMQYKPAVLSLGTSGSLTSASPLPSHMSPELQKLQTEKQAAITREDYMEAQNLKVQIGKLLKLEKLRRQKQAAVQNENYLHAMELKKQIEESRAEYEAEYDGESAF